jgi:hypothetical protein
MMARRRPMRSPNAPNTRPPRSDPAPPAMKMFASSELAKAYCADRYGAANAMAFKSNPSKKVTSQEINTNRTSMRRGF